MVLICIDYIIIYQKFYHKLKILPTYIRKVMWIILISYNFLFVNLNILSSVDNTRNVVI